ncbi:SH3 domain-containing protein [Bradyrhizobium liaoningense]|uniref:SH3 domain-containing protein n=1 Tax=Bradyrhizobium liaoningense TaxID=43992 RepID=UPI001BAC7284|nr:SH3 domain-containing protein [Bradyrhizobium liaoningense]MBR1029379.1 SH3 domain-containing protein [Bradyrhizobium liaoningense]
MKPSLLIACSIAFMGFTTASVIAEEDIPAFGQVTTNKKTALKTAPSAQASASRMVEANTELRWVRGDRRGKYVRVIAPKGPTGWVLASDVKSLVKPDLSSIALEGTAQPCVSPETIKACTTKKPTGCAAADSAHGAINLLKRTMPQEGAVTTVTFDTFSQLQSAAEERVDQGVEIEPSDRAKIKSIETAEGTVGEGSLVRLVAFLSEGKPHANTGESVNCNLKGEDNNDLHISVTEKKNGSEFDGIVVEMIPQDRPDNWTAADAATLRGKVLLIEGALLYDNMHVTNGDANNPLGGQPKRFSLWEIHPITSVKVCKKAAASQCDPDRPSDWKDF